MTKFTLVLGGAASGKSVYAEKLIRDSGLQPHYIATAQPFDDEMRAKIAAHRKQRGTGWKVSETPVDPGSAIRASKPGEVLLLDCATLWLSNVMLAELDVSTAVGELTDALEACSSPVVVVSNETGSGIVPENRLARDFRNSQGRLNQRLAEIADTVVIVIAGLPMVLKGQLP